MNTSQLTSMVKEHQVLALATVAGTIGVWFAVFRKSATPIINVTTPAPVAAGLDSPDTLAQISSTLQNIEGLVAGLPATPPTNAPPVSPTPSPAEHVATSIGDSGNPSTVFTLNSNGSFSPTVNGVGIIGAVYNVVQDAPTDGTLWWRVTAGPYTGRYIRYHDSAWSVSP